MKLRTRPFLAALSVLLPGALGLAVIGRTLTDYWARDPLAAGIVGLMGIALLTGLVDLLVRQQRLLLVARELTTLPQSPSEATVDGASPLLAGILRARLEQAPAPGFGESLAPFLTGLLVMLGLLGTLLGLFETVRGAGRALVSSGDVEALRQSLATPIDGLTRSFGCSAAGISASAMLGLCLAIVRRREARVLRAVQIYALGPLRALSPSRRQARALEQLTSQGLALPQAASALEQVGKQLDALAQRLVGGADAALTAQGQVIAQLGARLTAAQEAATAAQGRTLTLLSGQLGAQQEAALSSHEHVLRSLGDELIGKQETALAAQERALDVLLSGLRDALEHTATRAGETLHARVAPLVHETVAQTSEALARQAAMLAQATQSVGSALAADATARRDETVGLLASVQARMDEAMQARLAAHEAELEKLTELARRPLAESEARERAIAERSADLAAQLSESVRLLREAEAQQETRLGALATRLGDDLGGLAESLRAENTARMASERAHDERAQKAMERLAASAAMLDESCGRQSEAIERLVAEVPPMLGDAAASAQRGAQEGVSRLVQATDDRLSKISALIGRELEGRLAREKAELAHAEATRERLERGAALLAEGMARQGEVLEALVTRVAGLFEAHAAATQQSAEEALRQLLASAEAQAARFDQQAAKTQENAEATLSLMAEGAEAQAARFTALEAGLADNRTEHARGLATQLSDHAALLDQKLGGAMEAVREAAGTWQATSVEMQAVAELFAKSVERQREASDAWLASLGEVEGAVEQAGRSAAADALSDQLASTQEVFARQLQFQRELFDQLRALRSAAGGHGAGRSPSGEHDVSV